MLGVVLPYKPFLAGLTNARSLHGGPPTSRSILPRLASCKNRDGYSHFDWQQRFFPTQRDENEHSGLILRLAHIYITVILK